MGTAVITDGGAAFPRTYITCGAKGMSLRDYFAAQALPAVLHGYFSHGEKERALSELAEVAYRFADAMLKEKERKHDD